MRPKSVKITIITSVLLVSLVIFMLNSINHNPVNAKSDNQLTVATSFYPMYLHTINVTKGVRGVKVINMTEPQTGCLHDYQLAPNDLKTLEKADVFVVNGAGMEAFLGKVLKQMPKLKIIEASQGITLIKGDGGEGGNPHVWVSVSNAIQQVRNIGDQLAKIDPVNGGQYRKNTVAYIKKLEALRKKMRQALDGIPNRNIITFHEAFPYFAKEFNLNIVAVIEREPGAEPSAREIAGTIEIIKKAKVKGIFAEPQYPAKAAQTIARETGVKVYTLDPVVTGAADGDLDAYLKAMEKNLKSLVEALQ
ncbi:MAG: metal ABC transporter substrate-binding protein [Firmicutes bacterium]|nr:metal ABC transporter substrate-binding protein [Bacillota bacterium]